MIRALLLALLLLAPASALADTGWGQNADGTGGGCTGPLVGGNVCNFVRDTGGASTPVLQTANCATVTFTNSAIIPADVTSCESTACNNPIKQIVGIGSTSATSSAFANLRVDFTGAGSGSIQAICQKTEASSGSVPGGADKSVQYNNAGTFDGLPLGNSGDVLTSGGAGATPSWTPPSGGGGGGGQGTLVSSIAELEACWASGDHFTRCALAAGTRLDVGAGLVLPVVNHTVPRNGGTRAIICNQGAGFFTTNTTPGLELVAITNVGGHSHDMEIRLEGCQVDGAGAFNQFGLVMRGGHPGRVFIKDWGIGHAGLGGPGNGSAILLDDASYTQIKFDGTQAENTNGSLSAALQIKGNTGHVTWHGGRLFDVSGAGGGCVSYAGSNGANMVDVQEADLVCYPHFTDLSNGGSGHTSTENELSVTYKNNRAMLNGTEVTNAEGFFVIGPGKVNLEVDWRRRRDPSNTQTYGVSTAPMVAYRKTTGGGGGGSALVTIYDDDCKYRPTDGVFKGFGVSWFLLTGMDLEYITGVGCNPLGQAAIFDAAWPDGQQPRASVRDSWNWYTWQQTNPSSGVPEALPGTNDPHLKDEGAGRVLVDTECYGQVYQNTSANEITLTLPAAVGIKSARKAHCTAYAANTGNVCFKPGGTDRFLYPGLNLDAGDRICTSGGAGGSVTVRALGVTGGASWGVTGFAGTLVDGGP